MARISPETYKPILQFRFKIIFTGLDGIQVYGYSSTLPEVENNPITVEYGNTYMKLKGKTRWNDITFQCYAYEELTFESIWTALTEGHQKIDEGKDYYASVYKGDIQIQLLSPDNEKVVSTWKLVGAFINSIRFGQVNWSSNELVQPEIVISYDYALFDSQALKQQNERQAT